MNDELIKTIGLFRSIDKMNRQEYLNDISTIEYFCAAHVQFKKNMLCNNDTNFIMRNGFMAL